MKKRTTRNRLELRAALNGDHYGEPEEGVSVDSASQSLLARDFATPRALTQPEEFRWDRAVAAVENFQALGRELAAAGNDLFRRPGYGDGLLLAVRGPTGSRTVAVDTAPKLDSVITDRVRVRVVANGRTVSGGIRTYLKTMLGSEAFLQQFPPLDVVTETATFLPPSFSLARPGYNEGGFGHRILYVGEELEPVPGLKATLDFLDVMAFASEADRTNALAAALTVLLRNFWPGGKPLILLTSSKSHGGKGTVAAFAAGRTATTCVSHQEKDWPVERAICGAVRLNPQLGAINLDNVRIDGTGSRAIKSCFLERILTDPEPMFFSTGTGPALRRRNDLVFMLTSNFGRVSDDLMNRALPIHLCPVGNVESRRSPIGNPKYIYLPQHQKQIELELVGLVTRWRQAGQPRDTTVTHPFSEWAQTIGGILQVAGQKGFLTNYGLRKTLDDPVREGLGMLGSKRPDQWLSSGQWAELAADEGLTKRVIGAHDRDTEKARERGMGVTLTNHVQETFTVEVEGEELILQLERERRRFEAGRQPARRYRFHVVEVVKTELDSVDASTSVSERLDGAVGLKGEGEKKHQEVS